MRGRGNVPQQNQVANYPGVVGFNQYPGAQPGAWNRPQRRDGPRGQNQEYSFYPRNTPNAHGNNNYRNNASGGYQGASSASSSGTVNAAFRSLPHYFPSYDPTPFNDPRKKQRDNESRKKPNQKNTKRNQRESDTASQRSDATTRTSRSRNESEGVLTSCYRMYLCPKCGENYTFRQAQNKYSGKVPLILQCDHTMCQECIYQNLKNYKVNCAICKNDSVLSQEQTPVCLSDVQDIFSPNFYIIGVLSYYRPHYGHIGNLENIKFVSTAMKKHLNVPNLSDRCCFTTCSKEATLFCPSCEGIYCEECCTIVHKSTSKLMSHQPVPRCKNKFSLMLEMCVDHPSMPVEFFCKTCDINACCYCFLDNHNPEHERIPLYHLNETEMEEFKQLKLDAEKALKEVLSTQKKTASLANFNTESVKKKICQYFADYHAKIISIEKRLCNEVECFKTSNRGLDAIQSNLTASAEQLKQLVAFDVNKMEDKKFNLRGALQKLKEIDNIPRFLLNEAGSGEPITFVPNLEAVESLNNEFVLKKCQDSEYRLVTKKDLPENYVFDLDDSESEFEEIASVTATESNPSSVISLSSKPNVVRPTPPASIQASNRRLHHIAKKCIDMEAVDVQHINSMDSFFIQYKAMQSKLNQLNKDIENYVKMGGAQAVKEPQLNDLYLSLYITESQSSSRQNEQKWLRARLVDIKHEENETLYDMLFIDYGKTQTIDINRIKDIPTFLVQKKPFAVECKLHNPMNVNWSKQAHYSLAKILNGKQVSILTKTVNNGIHEVDLLIASSDGGVTSVTDILVHATNSLHPVNDDSASLEGSVTRKNVFIDQPRVFPNSRHFSKGEKEKVIIANVVDPNNVFVHLVVHQEAFKAMTRSIKKHFKSNKTSGCIPYEGTYVLVEYKDQIRSNWHRAFVKAVDLNNDKIQVLLVDWGISVVVSASKVKPIPEEFTKLESQAVLLKLAHIAPYNRQCVWSQHASNFLQAFHNSQTVLKMVVHETKPEVEVALFDSTSTNVDLCLNAMLVEQNLADSIGPVSKQLEWPQYTMRDASFSEEDSFMSSLLKKVDDEVHEDSEEEDLTNFKKRQVDVVKVEAPDKIWVQFLDYRDRYANLFNDIQIHYSQGQPTKEKWEIGDLCVVELEKEYARGRIVREENQKYIVYLYDKIEEVPLTIDRIFVYDQYFMKYPQIVLKSHLANIRPAGDTGKWSSSSIEALQEIFLKHNRIFANKPPESDSNLSSIPLDMWYGRIIQGGPLDPDRIKYVSINSFLVKLGYAYRIPKPVTPKKILKKASNGDELLQGISGDTQETSMEAQENASTVDKNEAVATALKKEKIEAVKAVTPEKKRKQSDLIINMLAKNLEKMRKKKSNITKQEQGDGSGKEVLRKEDSPIAHSSKSSINWSDMVDAELKESHGEISNQDDDNQIIEEVCSPYHKKEVVIDDWLPPFRLTKKEFMAKVTCVETGGHLYLHEEDMDAVYIKMEANIKEYFDINPPDISDHIWEAGQLCTIKYNDGKWYRGKILKVKDPKTISVFMIDFGSDHDLSPEVLFREVLYTDIGAFATRVKLDKVYCKSDSWLSSDYDNMHDLVSDWCKIIVKGPLEVNLPLVDVYNENGDFVNQKLVEICPNLSRCYNFPIGTEEEDDDTVVIESIESDETFANEMVMDRFDQELQKKNSVPLSTYKKAALPRNLIEGKKVLFEIGGVINYNKVAIKIPDTEVCEEMYDLVMSIQESIDSISRLTDLKVGMPCLAPFSQDGVWYRGKIRHTNSISSGFVEIYFVDYGNSESVAIDHVKKIPSEYLELAEQSWEANINVTIENDSDLKSVLQLISTLDGKRRYIELVKDDPLTVDIYDKKDLLCYQTLLDSGSLKPLY